ncbi:MAG: hypothetical protein GY710_08725 [Desulfobacteraceae bacterium]|nr:hypothetical protein [Desulfobacteraceae bacterium]
MEINNIDFVADVLEKGNFLIGPYKPFSTVKAKMNEWLSKNDVEIINIETILMTEVYNPNKKGSEEIVSAADGQFVRYYQFIRVWYRG